MFINISILLSSDNAVQILMACPSVFHQQSGVKTLQEKQLGRARVYREVPAQNQPSWLNIIAGPDEEVHFWFQAVYLQNNITSTFFQTTRLCREVKIFILRAGMYAHFLMYAVKVKGAELLQI